MAKCALCGYEGPIFGRVDPKVKRRIETTDSDKNLIEEVFSSHICKKGGYYMSPRKMVKMGPQADKSVEVISAWSEPNSKFTTVYTVQLRADGVISCDCPGWVNMASKDKITGEKVRACTHCRNHLNEAQEILDGKRPREFRQDPDLMQKLLMNRGTPGTLTASRKPVRRRMILTEGLV
jgi:hypothetical protein